MKKHYESNGQIIRSGTRIRESVRCLPKGHFQQIRDMFDKRPCPTRNLSTIHERQMKPKPVPSLAVLKLPVTDDEKIQRTTTNIDDIVLENDKSSADHFLTQYEILRSELLNKSIQPSLLPSKHEESHVSSPNEKQFHRDTLSYTTSLPQQLLSPTEYKNPLLTFNQRRQLAMATAINYADSYESPSPSNRLNRADSARHYVSNLQRTLAVHAKPVLVKTTSIAPKFEPTVVYDSNNELFQSSRSFRSSASLSSTGYDSNSSPSTVSKRNSLVTDRSNDHSISSDERPSVKPWMLYESGIGTSVTLPNSYLSDDIFDNASVISRSNIKLNHSPPSTLDRRPLSAIHHTTLRTTSAFDSPSMSSASSSSSAKYIVQTTSFPDSNPDDKKIHVNNDRVETFSLRRQNKLGSTSSIGFQTQQQRVSVLTPVVVQKTTNEREESPLPMVENPLFQQLPPRKPPRTFQHENQSNYPSETLDQKIPSSSSSTSDSPTFDLGARSLSCMDLTAGVSSVLLSSGLLPLDQDHFDLETKSNVSLDHPKKFTQHENIYEELKTPISTLNKNDVNQIPIDNRKAQTMKTLPNDIKHPTPIIKSKVDHPLTHTKSVMKKGVSEPNLAKAKSTSSSSTFFSKRGLIERFKRILPLSLSKQSLNEKSFNDISGMAIDSDDSASTTSENNDDIRTSRLDHVSRVKNVYDSLGAGSHVTSLFTDPIHIAAPRELKTLYDYVVHIVPEQEIGYFANGNGCLSSSNLVLNYHVTQSTSIRFKYPLDANDEPSLKYFCFPDQHDSNNNQDINSYLSPKKTKPEYFRFTLTDMHGVRQHGYCSRFVHKSILNALCIISPYDMIDIYEKILSTATELFISYKDEDARLFLQEIYPHRLPNRGDTIHIHTTTVGLYTLKCEYDRRKQLIDSITLLSLSTDTIIKVFSSILYEQKLIFISNDLGPLTRLINTFVGLLYPFSWPHTYIPILPSLMLDIMQAPTPYIIGILRSCEHYLFRNDEFLSQDNSDILIVDIDHDRIRSINDYLLNESYRGSLENFSNTHNLSQYQILPKIFKIELKQEISLLRKNKLNLSYDECRQRLQNVFMSIFVQSCYNYKDYLKQTFDIDQFVQSKQHTIELFLEWFTRTQIFELFIRKKLDSNIHKPFAVTFDLACDKYRRTLKKQTPQRITVKSVKRKAAIRANKQDNRL